MRLGSIGKVVAVCAVMLALGGCHTLAKIGGSCHDPKPYMKAESAPPLMIPAGLDAADTSSALKIPQLKEPAPPPRKGNDPCLDEPPAFSSPAKAIVPQARSIMPPAFPVG